MAISIDEVLNLPPFVKTYTYLYRFHIIYTTQLNIVHLVDLHVRVHIDILTHCSTILLAPNTLCFLLGTQNNLHNETILLLCESLLPYYDVFCSFFCIFTAVLLLTRCKDNTHLRIIKTFYKIFYANAYLR